MLNGDIWLSSKEAKNVLKVSDCHLSHMRKNGELVFVKKGNAFLYSHKHIESLGLKNLSNGVTKMKNK